MKSERDKIFREEEVIRNNSVKRKLATAGLIALAAATVVGGRPAQAQQTEIEALREQLEAMQARLDSLETAKIVTDEAAKATPNVTATQPVRVSGLLQFRGDSFFSQGDIARANQRSVDTFRIRRGEIRLTAPTITPRISGTVMFDLARGISSNTGATAASASFGANPFQELQLSYLLKKAKVGSTDNIFLDAGQFKIPLGYEGDLISSGALQTIERALIFTARDPFSGGFGDVRDTGVQLRGTFGGQFDYRLAAFNGLGERQNQLATSDSKALVARLAYRPTSLPGLIFGVSGATGDTRVNSSVLGNNFSRPRSKRDAFNVFGAYKKDKMTLQAEYLTADTLGFREITPIAATVASLTDIKGYYASVGYLFTPKLEGVFRYDYLDVKTRTTSQSAFPSDTGVRDLVLGLNYYLKGNNAKIQANLIRRSGAAGLATTTAITNNNNLADDSTQLRIQGQVSF